MSTIKDSDLKPQGFIRQKDGDHFVVRVKTKVGNVTSQQMARLSEVASKYGRGEIYLTTRLNIIIPWVARENLDEVRTAVEEVGLVVGGTGPRVRPVVACVGTICDHGMADTLGLGKMLDERFAGRKLPAKLKIGITGCSNDCAKAELNDIGFMGKCTASAKVAGAGEKCFAVYIGGMFGRAHRIGVPVGGLLSADEAVELVGKVIEYMEKNGRPGERLGALIDRVGMEEVLRGIGLSA
ncbi:MAG TPA: hypothetical protein VN455_14235 [Methanotrichaceae archaeon]|nr:hypothetical protein [Methanotrichaceae archaeon]